jgi:hypothetical protein
MPGSDACLSEPSMLNLSCRAAGVVLICSDCRFEWPVNEGLPFVSQLRLVALGHRCPARVEADGAGEARPSHLHLVTDQ